MAASRLLVAARADPAVLEARRRRLAEVVAQRAEHHGEWRGRSCEVGDQRRRLVDDLERVVPHVALGVPARVLRRVRERNELRRERRAAGPTR